MYYCYGTYVSLLVDEGQVPVAPATGHAPARIPNHRRLLLIAGALAQHLQHVCVIFYGAYVPLLSDEKPQR